VLPDINVIAPTPLSGHSARPKPAQCAGCTGAPDRRAGGTGCRRHNRGPDFNRSRQGAVEHQRADLRGFQSREIDRFS
jgi:hypothetical protein